MKANIENSIDGIFEAIGAKVKTSNFGKSRSSVIKTIRGFGLLVYYWPNTRTVRVFGRSFKSTPEKLAADLANGRIKPDEDATEDKCRICGNTIYRVISPKGKNISVGAHGQSHSETGCELKTMYSLIEMQG